MEIEKAAISAAFTKIAMMLSCFPRRSLPEISSPIVELVEDAGCL